MVKNMLRTIALVSVCLGAGASLAEEAHSGWQPILVGGLTKGGDVLYTVQIVDNGGTQHAYAGNLFQLGVGGLWTAKNMPFALGLSVNYHIEDSTAANGAVQFIRTPLEAIAYYLTEDRDWRAGFGLRYVTGVRLQANSPDSATVKTRQSRFEDTKGLVAEAGWAFGNNVWLNFRVVKELYQEKSMVISGTLPDGTPYDGVYFDRSRTEKVNGSHVGFNIVYAF